MKELYLIYHNINCPYYYLGLHVIDLRNGMIYLINVYHLFHFHIFWKGFKIKIINILSKTY